ncbi:hypothetical protein ACWEQ7_25565 [Streptomyces sp. NPDC004069]
MPHRAPGRAGPRAAPPPATTTSSPSGSSPADSDVEPGNGEVTAIAAAHDPLFRLFQAGVPEKVLTRDEILDAISLYWLTDTGGSSSRLYWEGYQAGGGPFNAVPIPDVPVAVTVFPGEIYPAPRSWGERTFGNIIHWNEVDRGGHFAAWEQPQILTEELRTAFRSQR